MAYPESKTTKVDTLSRVTRAWKAYSQKRKARLKYAKAISNHEDLTLSTAEMDFGILRDTYAPCRPLSSSPSLTRLGAMNSELYSFRSKLAGLQPEADTDKDDEEGGNMFDDGSCVLVEKLQTPRQPSTLSTPGSSPMERSVIYHFPGVGVPILAVPNATLEPDHHESDFFGTLFTDPPPTNPQPDTPTSKRPTTPTSNKPRKRARTLTSTDTLTDTLTDDGDWVFMSSASASVPVKDDRPPAPAPAVVVCTLLRHATRNMLELQRKCNLAELQRNMARLQRRCGAVPQQYQYHVTALLRAGGGGRHQMRQPGTRTKCIAVGGGGC